MSHDLSLAQSHAFQLSRDLMVPVTVFAVDGEYGVLPSDEIDDGDDLEIVHEFFPGRLIEPPFAVPAAACERVVAREATPGLANPLQDSPIANPALAAFALRAGREGVREERGKEINKGRSPCDRKDDEANRY